MIREAPAMTVRQNLGELLNEVQYRHGKVLITKIRRSAANLDGTMRRSSRRSPPPKPMSW